MATFSTSQRLIRLYKTCDGRYMGIGLATNKPPKRLKVVAFFDKPGRRRSQPWRMNMMLHSWG
jgi:hypothetical protein